MSINGARKIKSQNARRHRKGAGSLARKIILIVCVIAVGVFIVGGYAKVYVGALADDWTSASFSSLAVGGHHSCGIERSTLYCWGHGTNGQLGNNGSKSHLHPTATYSSGVLAGKVPSMVSAGQFHSCAVASGAAYCWGFNGFGRLGNNSTTQSLVPVAVDTSGVLAGKTVTSVSAGVTATCAVASGAAYCWGANSTGQLGDNSTTQSLVPVAVDTSGVLAGKTVTSISMGEFHACAVASGAAYCWGYNASGQLGDNSTTQSLVPVAVNTSGVLSGKTVTSIAVVQHHTCAVASGAAYCWGFNGNGQLGDNSTTQSLVPVAVNTSGVLSGKTVTSISPGQVHACAVASGAAYCWGNNNNGQLGDNSTTQSLVPVAVDTSGVLAGKTVTAVSSGVDHVCAIANSQVACWGNSASGKLANGMASGTVLVPVLLKMSNLLKQSSYRYFANANSSMPGDPLASTDQAAVLPASWAAFRLRMGVSTNMTVNTPMTKVATGETTTAFSCGVAGGAAYCWGYNLNGQLGNNTYYASTTPVPVYLMTGLAGKTVTDISTSSTHACAVASGAAYCWGNNGNGQLGNNSTTSSPYPVAVDTSGVLAGKTVTAINVGITQTCAIASGAAYCWGNNGNGQLGNNSTTQSLVPVAVNTSGVLAGKTITSIGVSSTHACAVGSSLAYCWGNNANGQLGNNSTTQSLVPVAVRTSGGVLNGKTMTDISAVAESHTCAVGSGAAYCWGSGTSGRLGNNSTAQSLVPVAVDTSGVLAGKTVTSIAAHVSHSCAVASSAAYCWGHNANGQLGNNSTTQSLVPVAVDTSGVLAGKTVTSIAAASFQSCAVASDAAYCWGNNNNGSLGDDSVSQALVPVAVTTTVTRPLVSGTSNFKLRFAQKTAASCSAQMTGFADVTTTSAIAWNTNAAVANGATISLKTGDPTPSGDTIYQTYVSGGTTFTNANTVPANKHALWDFSLKDNSGLNNTTYCIRIIYATALMDVEQYGAQAEITTAPAGSALGVEFIDSNGNALSNPSLAMESKSMLSTCQSTGAFLGNETTGTMLRIYKNSGSSSWNATIAPTSGSTALWARSDNNAHYDFNDPSGSPAGCNSGSDGDGYAGQLSIATDTSVIIPRSSCTNSGLTWDVNGTESFSQGVTDAITLLSGSSGTVNGCYWDISETELTQTLPAYQASGAYDLDFTVTVLAQ